MAEITMGSIIKKLGFDPLRHNYCKGIDWEDDNWENPLRGLSSEELMFIYHAALADPKCYAKNQEKED